MNVQRIKNNIFMNVRQCGWRILDVVCDNVIAAASGNSRCGFAALSTVKFL